MKKAKAIGRIIITFLAVMLVSLAPTFMFRTGDEITFLLRQPGCWVWSVVLAVFITWWIFQAEKNSNK